jgi:hypothetical protein
MTKLLNATKQVAGKVLNGHSQAVKSTAAVGVLLGITGYLARGWTEHVNESIKGIPQTQIQLAAHIAQASEAFANLKMSDTRTNGQVSDAVLNLKDAIEKQREDAKEWRDQNAKRWDRQNMLNDAVVITLEQIRDKLPDKEAP